MFRSRTPRSAAAAALSIVLIAAFMVGTTSAAANQQASDRAAPAAPKPKPSPTPTPTPVPTPTPTPPNSDTRKAVLRGPGYLPGPATDVLSPSIVTAGNTFAFDSVRSERRQPAADPLRGPLRQPGRSRANRIDHAEPARGHHHRVGDAQWGCPARSPPRASARCATWASSMRARRRPCSSSSTPRAWLVDDRHLGVLQGRRERARSGRQPQRLLRGRQPRVGATNSNSNATYKIEGDDFSLSTAGNTLVKKDTMTTTVDGYGRRGRRDQHLRGRLCTPAQCTGQIATVHVQDGAQQTPYLKWTLVIIGSFDGVITHELDNGNLDRDLGDRVTRTSSTHRRLHRVSRDQDTGT